MHEDIELKTENWGQIVLEIFQKNQDLGLVGVAGSSYKSLAPSGWGTAPNVDNIYHINLIQSYKDKTIPSKLFYSNFRNEKLTPVACIDGVWFCTKKDYVMQFPFDEELLKGFHCYDLDFSLSIGQKFKVAVTYDVLMEHFSEGSLNESWLIETLKLHEKWKDHLPVNVADFTKKECRFLESAVFIKIFDKMNEYNFKTNSKLRLLTSNKLIRLLGFKQLLRLYFYLFLKASRN